MSEYYRGSEDIMFADVFDGRLKEHGITEEVCAETTEDNRCLTDKHHRIWVYRRDDGVADFHRRSFTYGYEILWAIADVFGVEMLTEHDHRYSGFASEEEQDAFHRKISEESDEKLYNQLIVYLKDGELNPPPSTNFMILAKIARELVEVNPKLLLPEHKTKLMADIHESFFKEHVEWVQFTEVDMRKIQTVVTPKKDLPQA